MTPISTTADRGPAQPAIRDRLCAKAIEHFGRFGFDTCLLEMSIAADVEVAELEELFGDIAGLRAACDDYLLAAIRDAKTEALTSQDPQSWHSQLAGIGAYAPMLSYLVRSLDTGDESGRALFHRMTDNAEAYLEAGVRAGTLRPTSDPKGRAHLLAMFGGGGFLLYRTMHPTPDDMAAVLRDYASTVMMPALELYTYGLMADDSMYRSFQARKAVP